MKTFLSYLNETFYDPIIREALSHDLVDKAREFAIRAHGEQKYGTKPYSHHLTQVFNVLKRFHFTDPELQAAAWLHDTVEDTDASLDDIKKEFPHDVAVLVDAVTDEPGENRAARKLATYPKIMKVKKAQILKLADRIANVEEGEKVGKYQKEQPAFKEHLYVPGVADHMWDHLDRLLGMS